MDKMNQPYKFEGFLLKVVKLSQKLGKQSLC